MIVIAKTDKRKTHIFNLLMSLLKSHKEFANFNSLGKFAQKRGVLLYETTSDQEFTVFYFPLDVT